MGRDHGSLSATQAPRVCRDVPSPQPGAQALHVSTWFFFDSNNNILKFIDDDNNNTNSNF
jgi:hypothetical protein